MSLSAGTRLGPYEIVAPLGAGGMGEVYRARDTKLDRNVAVKVLPASVANDADALTRFERAGAPDSTSRRWRSIRLRQSAAASAVGAPTRANNSTSQD